MTNRALFKPKTAFIVPHRVMKAACGLKNAPTAR